MTRLLPLLYQPAPTLRRSPDLTVTGPHGTATRTCDRTPRTCPTHSTVTVLNGATRSNVTTGAKGQITSTRTRATGQTFTRTTAVTRYAFPRTRGPL